MRKYFDAIQRIAGNVVTVNAGGVGYDDLAVITSTRGDSLAQVIRLQRRSTRETASVLTCVLKNEPGSAYWRRG